MSATTARSPQSEEERFGQLKRRWALVQREQRVQARRESQADRKRIGQMRGLEAHLRRSGRWISGPVDLMSVLGLAYDEVRHCRVLRWLLDPSAPHGLGGPMLERLLEALGLEAATIDDAVTVVVEEVRQNTRADLIVRGSGWTVLIEAKVLAPETGKQCDRMRSLWADENPSLVFLTIRGTLPVVSRPEGWVPLTWSTVAGWLSEAIAADPGPLTEARQSAREACHQHLLTMRRTLR